MKSRTLADFTGAPSWQVVFNLKVSEVIPSLEVASEEELDQIYTYQIDQKMGSGQLRDIIPKIKQAEIISVLEPQHG